jgi:threonine/homoserine/homoserine lactone efflux protein
VTAVLGFLGVSALVIMTPGQDTLLTVQNTLRAGRRGGLATALGVAAGQSLWTLAAAFGLAALIAASEPAFAALRLAGAGYLVLLGLQTLRSSARRNRLAHGEPLAPRVPSRTCFRQGMLSNLGNPKMALFFAGFLPQFASGGSTFWLLLGLGFAFCGLTLAWLSAYAVVVARAGALLRGPVRRTFEAVAGALLVAVGVRLALERR